MLVTQLLGPLADFQPDDLLGLVAVSGIFLIIIVKTMAAHQRKMTAIIHGSQQKSLVVADDSQVRQEMQELRQLVNAQTIAIDNLATEQARLNKVLQGDQALREQLSSRS